MVARDTLLEVRCRSYLKGICFMGMACLTYFVSYHIKLAISSFSLYENCHIKLLSLWGMACLTYLFSYHYVFGNNWLILSLASFILGFGFLFFICFKTLLVHFSKLLLLDMILANYRSLFFLSWFLIIESLLFSVHSIFFGLLLTFGSILTFVHSKKNSL